VLAAHHTLTSVAVSYLEAVNGLNCATVGNHYCVIRAVICHYHSF